MTLASLQQNIADLQTRFDRDSGALESIQTRLQHAKERRSELAANLIQYDLERILLSKVSDMARARVKTHVEQTVTAALQSILGRTDMRFEVSLRDLGGQPAADFHVISVQDGEEVVADPEDGRGGGVLDICSIALRMCVLELSEPRIDGPLIIDEGGKHISRQYLPAMAEFLKEYARRTGRQVLFVSHAPELADAADKAYRVALVDGVSEVSVA